MMVGVCSISLRGINLSCFVQTAFKMQAFTIIEQQLQELSRELQNKDKLIGRYMDQQALDAGFKKAQDLKYFR